VTGKFSYKFREFRHLPHGAGDQALFVGGRLRVITLTSAGGKARRGNLDFEPVILIGMIGRSGSKSDFVERHGIRNAFLYRFGKIVA
jgi:hypothetical protein